MPEIDGARGLGSARPNERARGLRQREQRYGDAERKDERMGGSGERDDEPAPTGGAAIWKAILDGRRSGLRTARS